MRRRNFHIVLPFLIVVFYLPCYASQDEFPLKIGLVADTQITTDQGIFNKGLRRKQADWISPVAIRATAVERLATEVLDYQLEDLVKKKPNLILYLGDGANSGCRDEHKMLFKVLRKYQEAVPIFFAIGNHDYLGAGMTAPENQRTIMCGNPKNVGGRQRFLNKYEVVKRISKFNSASATLHPDKVKYFDNIEWVNKRIDTLGGLSRKSRDDHYEIFFVGVVDYLEKDVQFVLADTSDYGDSSWGTVGRRRNEKRIGLWGLKGWISHDPKKAGRETQVAHMSNMLKSADVNPKYRFIASHYPLSSFHWRDFLFKLFRWRGPIRKKLGSWLEGAEKTYWLSAHTHKCKPKRGKYGVGQGKSKTKLLGLTIGSTTDFEPHLAIIDDSSRTNNTLEGPVGYSKIAINVSPEDISNLKQRIKESRGSFKDICGILKKKKPKLKHMQALLGLNKYYRKGCWNKDSDAAAAYNLRQFIAANSDWNERRIKMTLFWIGAHREESFYKRKCG